MNTFKIIFVFKGEHCFQMEDITTSDDIDASRFYLDKRLYFCPADLHLLFFPGRRRNVEKDVSMVPRKLFVAIDPNGGCLGRRTGIVSGYFVDYDCRDTTNPLTGLPRTGSELVITGLDTQTCRSEAEQCTFLKNHILKLREQNSQFKEFHVQVIAEDNLGHEFQHISAHVSELQNVSVCRAKEIPILKDHTPAKRIGTYSYRQSKGDALVFLNWMLHKGRICLSNAIFVSREHSLDDNDDDDPIPYTAEFATSELKRQLSNARPDAEDELYTALRLLTFWPEMRGISFHEGVTMSVKI